MTSHPLTRAADRGAALYRRLGPRLVFSLLAVGAGVGAFLNLMGEVREGETTGFDRVVLLAFRRPGDLDTPIGPRWLLETARDITALGGFTVLTLITVLATVLLLMHGRRLQAMVFATSVVISQGLVEGLKQLLARARPELVPHHDLVYSHSFPSGHSAMTPVVYLTLAAIVAAGEERRSVRWLIIAAAGALTVAVGLSRVYLGVHWPTDVLGGWALGTSIAVAANYALHRAAPTPTLKPDSPGAP